MEEKGFGYIADVLVFSLLVSVAITFLVAISPVDPRVESERYASSFARGLLLSFQHSTADQFGGFDYSLEPLGFELNLPLIEGSARRELLHKTVAQLLSEDVLLNMRINVGETDLTFLKTNEAMDHELKNFLKTILEKTIGGRFGYRMRANTKLIDLGFARVYFEIEIEEMSRARNQLCSESVMLSLPESNIDLKKFIENALGMTLPSKLEIDTIIEVSLELWST